MIERVGLCRHAIVRPSDMPEDPFGGLARAMVSKEALPELKRQKYTDKRLKDLLRDAPQQIEAPLEAALEAAGQKATLAKHAQARLTTLLNRANPSYRRLTI